MSEPAATTTKTTTMREAINQAIAEAMEEDPNLVLLGQDIGKYGGTFGVYRGLYERFGPERVQDGPLCESATVGFGIGLAISGMRAIVELEFIDFTTVAMDQIVSQAAKIHYFTGGKLRVPLVIRAPIVSRLGMGSQHSQSLEAWLMHVPGLKVAIPSGAADALGLLRTALKDFNPVFFVENVRLYSQNEEVPVDYYTLPFGSARIAREGSDITVVAISGMVPVAVSTAVKLTEEGISVEVIDPRTLAPLDMETIAESVRKTGRVVVTHDAHTTAGVGAEIAARVMEEVFDYLDGPVARVCGLDVPIPAGPAADVVYPDEERLVAAIMGLLNR